MHYENPLVTSLDRIFDQNVRTQFLRLDLNENPRGLPIDFIQATLADITPEFVAEYPETLPFTEVLARHLGLEVPNICLTNGSSEAIRHTFEAFTSVNGKVLGVTPTYAMFEVYSKMYGRNFRQVHYEDDLTLSIDSIIEQMTPDIELLILVNPNNPMGNVYTSEEMEYLLNEAEKSSITVLIDEAYTDFYGSSFIPTALEHDNVLVTRTFSKLFSLAGCRLGYIVGKPEKIALVQKLCTPHNVNAFALLFAQRILETPGFVERLRTLHREGKARLTELLDSHGYSYSLKEGNFIFIQPKTDAVDVARRLKEDEAILVKSYPNVGRLGTCLRVTTADADIMERFVEALVRVDRAL